jgi:hypothetical protein
MLSQMRFKRMLSSSLSVMRMSWQRAAMVRSRNLVFSRQKVVSRAARLQMQIADAGADAK